MNIGPLVISSMGGRVVLEPRQHEETGAGMGMGMGFSIGGATYSVRVTAYDLLALEV